jgi:hypothetical protein
MKRLIASVLALALSVPACATPPAAPKVVLKTWVHIFGCPSTTEKKLGPQHVVLIFSDGSSLVLRVDTATDEKRELLKEFIGDLDGTNIKYECGAQA